MLFVTGDIHARPFPRLDVASFYEQKETKQDTDFVIICGDFGLVWDETESDREMKLLDKLEKKPFTTLFCDGNHENFDRLEKYPVEMWHGGKVHKIREHVIHLMRGQLYDLCGKKVFVFGGAPSHDIQDGVLEADDPRLDEWMRSYDKMFRVNHVTWWSQEIPSKKECTEGLATLDACDWKVDYVITHELPTESMRLLCARYKYGGVFPPNEVGEYLESIRQKLNYKCWFSGHHHEDAKLTSRDVVLYEQIVRIV